MRRVVLTLVAGLLLSGCGGGADAPGQATVDVDNPQLREAKHAARVEPCVPGDGDPVEGGLPQVTLPCLGSRSLTVLSESAS